MIVVAHVCARGDIPHVLCFLLPLFSHGITDRRIRINRGVAQFMRQRSRRSEYTGIIIQTSVKMPQDTNIDAPGPSFLPRRNRKWKRGEARRTKGEGRVGIDWCSFFLLLRGNKRRPDNDEPKQEETRTTLTRPSAE